jgi:catechol 2,3-dioxygenase-like lactoylglutathione lyase family enzyme
LRARFGRVLLAAAVVVCASVSAPAGAADRPPIVGVSHIAFHVSDAAKARAFYGGLLGYEEAAGKPSPDGRVRFRINGRQYVEIVPGLVAGSDDRLDHVAFETTNLDALRAYLAEKDVKTAEAVMEAGHRMLRVADPDGHAVEFVQYGAPSAKPSAAADTRRISARLLHIGLTVRDQAAADHFYKDVLGFSEIWRGGRDDAHTDWINMRVPDGTDYLEYMLVGSDAVDRVRLGSLHHMALLVPSIQDALETVRARPGGWDAQTVRTPQVGRNRRWQLNLFDPDGSRAELMEPYTMR